MKLNLVRNIQKNLVLTSRRNYASFKLQVPPNTVNGFVGAIGNTPLIRVNSLSNETGCEILAKAEFMNPGGSVKDRAALYVVLDAEEKGAIWKNALKN